METPVLLRGRFYNTNFAKRCPNFHSCVACKKCTHFNKHNAMCQLCEKGQTYRCSHSEQQKTAFVQIEMRMKRPLFETDAKMDAETTSVRQYVEETELVKLEQNLDGLGVVAQNVIE